MDNSRSYYTRCVVHLTHICEAGGVKCAIWLTKNMRLWRADYPSFTHSYGLE